MPPKYQRWKNIMKCYPFEEKRLLTWEPPYIVQPKYDGIRCRAVPVNSDIPAASYLLLSSEENVIYSVPHIIDALTKANIPRQEYDGELYTHGMSFEQITSITSRTVNIHPDHKEMNFHIFDIVNDKLSQAERLTKLNSLKYSLNGTGCLVRSPYWICDTLDEIMRVYDKLISMNYEGIIVRHHRATYERRRSRWVMKFKPKKEDTYEIIGYVEENTIDGTPKGRLGAITCLSGDGNYFSVGTGFDDSQREELWKQRGNLSGRFARVQYQHLTSGKKVPRFPVFVEVVDEAT